MVVLVAQLPERSASLEIPAPQTVAAAEAAASSRSGRSYISATPTRQRALIRTLGGWCETQLHERGVYGLGEGGDARKSLGWGWIFAERGVSGNLERILGAPGSRFGLRRVWAQRESVASAVPDSVFMADSQLG